MDDNTSLQAAMTGVALSVAANWVRSNNDTNDRLDKSREDIDGIFRVLRDFIGNGHIIREMMPIVADFLSGLAMARTQTQAATLVPTLNRISRPDLLSLLNTAIPGFAWPPVEGKYTPQGMVQQTGEIASLGLVLTYEEVRAWLHGLVLPKSPTPEEKMQSFLSAQGFVQAIVKQKLTGEEWLGLWKFLFASAIKATKSAPVVTAGSGSFSITSSGRNEAMNVVVSATGNVNAGTQIATIKFGVDGNGSTGFVRLPAIVTGGTWQIDGLSATQFVLTTRVALAANDVVTASILVGSTDA